MTTPNPNTPDRGAGYAVARAAGVPARHGGLGEVCRDPVYVVGIRHAPPHGTRRPCRGCGTATSDGARS